jgi:hypothetical protein
VCGFFTNAGIVGLYTLLALAYPTHLRATGTGVVIGAGRGGARTRAHTGRSTCSAGIFAADRVHHHGLRLPDRGIRLLFVKFENTSEAAVPAAAAAPSRP